MKKLMLMLLSAAMLLSIAACGQKEGGQTPPPSGSKGSQGSAGNTGGDKDIDWPGKQTVQIIVPYAAGGDTDYNARLLAEKLSEKTGATFVVSNVNGNGGATGAMEALNSPNDGSVVMFHHTAFLINNIYGSTDFLFEDAFDFCAVVGYSAGNVITMNASYGIKDLKGLIEYTQQHPGELKFTANTGATTHATALFLKNIGCDIQLVDAGSASERISSLLGGHVDIIDNSIGTIADYLKTGELVAICSDSDIANPYLEEEYGIGIGADQGYDVGLPFVYFTAFPAGTDPRIVQKMSDLLGEIINEDEDYAEQIKDAYCQVPYYFDTEEGYARMMEIYDKLSALDFNA